MAFGGEVFAAHYFNDFGGDAGALVATGGAHGSPEGRHAKGALGFALEAFGRFYAARPMPNVDGLSKDAVKA